MGRRCLQQIKSNNRLDNISSRLLEIIKKNNSIETLVKDLRRHFKEYETHVANIHRKSMALINMEIQIKTRMSFGTFDKQKFLKKIF